MSQSARKSHNRDTVGDNETIFDFLKRKKQFNLEHTLNKSNQHSHTKRKYDQLEEEFPQARDLTKYRTYETNRIAQTARQTITPKKLQFEEPNRHQHHHIPKETVPLPEPQEHHHSKRTKSFLAMISPIKQRPSSALEERKESDENQNRGNRSAIKTGKAQQFTKGKVTKCINTIKDTINNLNEHIGKIKEKSHGLSVLFNPIFNKFSSDPKDPLTKQVGDLKNKLKSFQAMINNINTQNSDEITSHFHKNIEDHIQGELAHLKKELSRESKDHNNQTVSQKQNQIERLQTELKKAVKDNELLVRKLELAQDNHGKIAESAEEREISHVQQLDRFKENYESTIQKLLSKNNDLQSKLQASQQQATNALKNYKSQKVLKESLEQKYREQIQQIIQTKDAYLLNEIMILKTEFNTDMARMTELHRLKEAELQGRIAQKEQQLNKRMFEKGCNKQIQAKILQQANLIKQQNLQLRNKSQCIITDMYRLNQELYQHWIALKDIKVLSNRLGSFAQYKKIYEDLKFNDQLFH